MANEASLRVQKGLPQNMQIFNNEAYEKGAVVYLVDANRVSGSSAVDVPFGGIVTTEKIASDGKTQLAVDRTKGNVYDVSLKSSVSGSTFVARGQLLKISGQNTFSAVSGGFSAEMQPEQAMQMGVAGMRALEDGSGTEVILAEII